MDRTDTTGASPAPIRLADRIGIVPRLLACAVLAMLLAVVSVQLWTLRSVEANGLQRAQQSLRIAMAVLQQNLAPYGSTWSTTPDGQLLLGSTKLNGRNDLVDAVREVTGASVTIFLADTRIATNVKNPDGSRGVGTKLAPGPAHDAALRDGQTYTGPATILGQPYLAIYQPIRNARAEAVGILFVGVPLTEAEAFMGRIIREAVLGTIVIALLSGFGYFWTLRVTIRPLSDLTSVMHRIADGELDSTVPCTGRKDQIGEMALALLQLRDASARARTLEAAAAARARAEAEKHAALLSMVDRVEADTTAAITQVGARTAAMTAAAEQMAASAGRTGNSAQSAATASAHALANAETVASAAEQLSASIREISMQMTRSGAIVGSAVKAGTATRASMEALNEQVGRIGAVADIISEIASRTNLLALNATIEAARAGAAGKGFAVVASEVKALATQTARSTQEIAQHIAEVRTATGASVTAVQRIEQTITEIDAIAGSIAAAVEQQGAATAEIARNIAETAAAAGAMTSHVNEVSLEAEQTGTRAVEVCNDAAGLNKAVVELRHAVIRTVRTSTTEMDRRAAKRYQVDLPCRLSVSGQAALPARLNDISVGGASLRGGPALPQGTAATLHVDGTGLTVPCVVHASDDDLLRLRFALDDATAAKVLDTVERLGQGRAA